MELWQLECETGFDSIDEQHQYLFDVVNRLHDAMSQGEEKNIIQEILKEMIDYTVDHFADEEKLMLQYDYPNYKEHKEAHNHLTQQLHEISEKLSNGDSFVTMELSYFLTQWLTHTIKGQDQKMICFLQEKKVLDETTTSV
ncbi:hemerythrin-like metal-binding protein [Halothece sp. PCC 7418]|nr:hemerythrin-like metal-binding protein [Halothece sp. PCC 7418]